MSFVCGCGSSFIDSTGLNVHCSMNQGHRQTVISGKRCLSAPAGRVTKRACMHVAGTGFVPINSALRGRVIHYFLKNETTIDEIDDFIRYVSDDLTTVLNDVTKHGKTLENVRKHQNIQLVCNPEKLSRLAAKPSFSHTTVFNKNLVAVHMYKEKINFYKPIFIGQAILDISKCIMYKFHYEVMMPLYGPERLLLCYMDTDSFIYLITTNCFHDDLKKYLLEYFDKSNYPIDHSCYTDRRKKQPGTFTDECKGKHMQEIIALLPKVYAYSIAIQNYYDRLLVTWQTDEVKRLKGMSTGVVKHEIKMVDYLNCLRGKLKQTRRKRSVIRTKHHSVSTVEINKLALVNNNNYDKRALIGDEGEYKDVYTKAWGHYSLGNDDDDEETN